MERVQLKKPDKSKWYLVRTAKTLKPLRKWLKWAKKTSKGQRFIIVDAYKSSMKRAKTPELKEYFKYRFSGPDDRYEVYGTY